MTISVQVTFKGMDPSPALEARIREKAAHLERFESDILRCHVTVEAPHRHHRQGRLYDVRIEVFVPRGDVVVVRQSTQDHAHEDPFVAVRDAFNAAVRQLEDHVRGLGGQVKHHEPSLLRGRIARFIADEGYGFIETSDGQEVYFHRNSVAEGRFEDLRVGEPVRLAVVDGEDGPQASRVQPADRHHASDHG